MVDLRGKFRAALLVVAAALASGAADAATFRWANDGDLSALDPYTRNETVQLSFLSDIYEPLIRRDRHLKLEPALAVKWERLNPKVWRFTLRPGVKWQDGSAFTADDVVFSAKRVKSDNSVLRAVLGTVQDVRKVDDLTVDIETVAPDLILPEELTTWLIMNKAWSEKNGAAEPVNLSSGQENYAVRHTMGTGPYMLVSREPDRRTVTEANPNWWDKREGNVTRVEFNVISNPSTRVAALLSGEIDMIYAVPTQDRDRIASTDGLRLISGPELRTLFLGLDQWRDELLRSSVKGKNPFKDVRVREAFTIAIDEPAIAARIMRGQAHPTALLWGKGVNGYDPALDVRPKVDVARAKQLLAEAGYPDGFSVGLDCPNDRYVNDEAICTAVVAMLARVGVKVDLTAQSKVRYFSKIGKPAYDTDFYLLGWSPPTYDAHNVLYNIVATRTVPQGEVNYAGYSNPEMDALVTQIAGEQDPARRAAEIHDAAVLLQKDFGYIPLHQQVITWAARHNVDLVQNADNWFPIRYVTVK